MKLLNLDELSSPSRPVMLNGKQYEIKEQSLEQLVASTKVRKTLDTSDPEVMLENMITTAHSLIPDAPLAEIRKLNSTQLNALITFANESDETLEQVAETLEEGK